MRSPDLTLATTLKISLWILYCTLFLVYFGATPGKLVMRLKVIEPARPSERPTAIVAVTRSAFFIISAFALALGCLWCLFDTERRTWHDRIARTRVVHTPD